MYPGYKTRSGFLKGNAAACPPAANAHSAYQANLTIAHGAAQPGGGLFALTVGLR
uniref:Uncharacterized protein n=1 Tax=viral metagenome TaxID=1070528 RepID=A0A6M3LNH5_9ZZZZ